MDYKALEEHIKDSVMEEQAKLGFRKEAIRLYYPVGMLNHLLALIMMQKKCKRPLQDLQGLLKNVWVK